MIGGVIDAKRFLFFVKYRLGKNVINIQNINSIDEHNNKNSSISLCGKLEYNNILTFSYFIC